MTRFFNTAGPVNCCDHYCLPSLERLDSDYMDKCGSPEGHLIIFDRNPEKPWEQKIFRRNETHDGKTITVWGM